MKKKINILFRWGEYNQYTLSALMGLLDEYLDTKKFTVETAESAGEVAGEAVSGENALTVLAYSFATAQWPPIREEIRSLKNSLGKKIIIICGGPHTTALPENALEAGADVSFVGESEESLLHFLKDLSETGKLPAEKIIRPLPLKDFDSYPPFAYKRDFLSPIELRRGCRTGCAFCQTPRIFRHVRERSVEYVEKYVDIIKEAGRDHVFFTIPDALSYGSTGEECDLDFLDSFLMRIRKKGINVHLGNFPSEVSPRKLARYPEAAGVLKKHIANSKITLGGQSGSDRMLKIMNRDHTVRDILESVKVLRAFEFTPLVDIIFGIPTETRADRMDTLRLMRTLVEKYHARLNVHYFMPLPGTPLQGKDPEPVEEDIKETVLEIMKNGNAYGDFFAQLEFQAA